MLGRFMAGTGVRSEEGYFDLMIIRDPPDFLRDLTAVTGRGERREPRSRCTALFGVNMSVFGPISERYRRHRPSTSETRVLN